MLLRTFMKSFGVDMFSLVLGIYLAVEFLGQMAILHLNFTKVSDCFPKWLYNFTFPPAVQEGPDFFTSSSTLHVTFLFDYSLPHGCKVVFHCRWFGDFFFFFHSKERGLLYHR